MPTYEAPPSARKVGLRQARIEWNRDAVGAIVLGMADAVEQVMAAVIADASAAAPRDPEAAAERGVPMLADTARISVFAGGVNKSGRAASLLVSGTTERMASRNKPPGARTPVDQVVGFAMFDSPLAHLVELGTVKMSAHPFLVPALNRHISGLGDVVRPAIGKRLAGSVQSVWARNPKTPPPPGGNPLASILLAEMARLRR
jgi:hypothetical protein